MRCSRWIVDYQDLWLIFTRRGIDIKKYPAIEKHLSKYKDRLTAGVEGGRKAGSYKWYEIQDNIAYWKEFESPKIVYQEIATYQSFAWDNSGKFMDKTTFMIPNAEMYLIAILNSTIVWFFLDKIVSKLQGGAYTMQSIYVSQIPIPTATKSAQKAIEILVQKCLDAKGQNVIQWEQQIDNLVYKLYGLTYDEVKIIDPEFELTEQEYTAIKTG